jgi:tetratricopeptide (TPR) repeat protein
MSTSTLREYEQALQTDPTLSEPFLALRKAYGESKTWDKLIILYELRAQALPDGSKASELFYLAGEIRLDHLDDPEGAEADLAHAIDRDPENLKAAERLKLLYRQQARLNDYMAILEVEAAALAQGKDPARKGDLARELGQFCKESLVKLERAALLSTAQRQTEVTPDALKLVESARKIYRVLGDFASVVRLYELELALTSESKRRSDLLLGLGRVLGERLGDLQGAAQRLGEVVRLRPRDDRALEALATVYAHPGWIGADGKEQAGTIYHQIARRRHEAGDIENAVAALRKALAAVPGHPQASELIEHVLYAARRFADLDLYYRERTGAARDLEEKMDFLFKRAQLAERDRNDPDEALRIYQEIADIEPAGGPASHRLVELHTAKQDWARLAELREKQIVQIEDPAFRLAILIELAQIYRERLGDPEQAAVYWHAVLKENPAHSEALEAYAEHFRQRGDWQSLVDLLDFSFEHARGAGHPLAELLERLEEIAVISERNLADSERALLAWQRMEELDAGHDRAREAQKRLLQKNKQWDRMAALLEREATAATEPAQKVDSLRRLSRVLLEKLNAVDRAVAVYRQILIVEPSDPVAFRALAELFEREARWAELAQLLRAQIDTVIAKAEKITLLRRLLSLYQDRLSDLSEGSWAAAEILKLQPGDREALEALEAILERGEDPQRLVETLEYHLRYVSASDEKLRLARRIAELLQNRLSDLDRATKWWEEILRLQPGDPIALESLVAAYEKLARPDDLGRVLEVQIAQTGQDPSLKAEEVRRLARLAEGALADPARAQRAWEELLRATPSDSEALEALSRRYAETRDWRALVAILERRIPLASDSQAAVALALERARIFEEELDTRSEAMATLEQLVAELDPRSLTAYARLRKLAEIGSDWSRVVSVAEKQLFLEDDPGKKAGQALQIGELLRDHLGDPRRAISAFERAIEIDPQNQGGLQALASLYAEAGQWQRLMATSEKLLELAPAEDRALRRRLLYEMAETAASKLGDAKLAFDLYRRAYSEGSDGDALQRLEEVAKTHALWIDLLEVYEGSRARATHPAEQVAMSLKIAGIVEGALGSPERAFDVLREALTSEPEGTTLLPELERLAAGTGDWAGLLDVYAQVARSRPEAQDKVMLLRRRASVHEQQQNNPSGALDEYLRALALLPDDESLRAEIGRLAEVSGRWEDAISVEAQRFSRTADFDSKVVIACRAAGMVEEKLKDRRRAFRAYLNAFRLAPENQTIVSHLWRIAALLEQDRVAEDAAAVELPQDLIEEVQELASDTPASAPAENRSRPGPGKRKAEQLSAWGEFAQAYELLPTSEISIRHRYLRRAADVWERGARDIARSLDALERAFKLDTRDEIVRAELRRIAIEQNRWETVCAIFARAAEAATREEAVALHHDVARFHEELNEPHKAEASYRAILQLKPDDSAALTRLEDLVRRQERWEDLAGLLEKRTGTTLDPLPRAGNRRKRMLELAELYDHRLERPYEAIDAYERFVDGMEDDERGTDHSEVVRESCDALESLSRLYARLGMWPKAVEALDRQIELGPEENRLRSLRWRIGEIRERELGQPEEAISAYEAILETAPQDAEALAALDRLLDAQGRYEPLQEILRRRAEQARGSEKVELIKRRARILEERLGNADAAAACLRALGPEAVRDEETAAALLRNLGRAGLAHEALRLLDQRIDFLVNEGAPVDKVAALQLQAAALRLDRLDDVDGARRSIEAALALHPENPSALGALARLHLRRNDFAAYAKARTREAEASGQGPEGAEAWLEAGRVLRDQLGKPGEARRCFERAAAADPTNAAALRGLAALLTAEGLLAEARAALEKQLQLMEEPTAKAVVLTDLARVLWGKPGDAEAAIARLDEALELAPDYLPAVVTMADVYYREQQWPEAERRLLQAVRRMRGQPGEMAQLYHRLGEVYEKLGRLDDGYRHLQEAERMMPGQLLIRLALGENRFQSKKWREATAYLQELPGHADAHKYPLEVAEGLSHAGEAEVRLKRPERAVLLYQAALRLVADHRPSLKAMAELALERGEQIQAALYLRRLAEGSGERAERARLFEQLGDVLQKGGDSEGSLRAYEDAVGLLDPPTESDIPLLDKTLTLQRAAGSAKAAAATTQRLLTLLQDPRERAARRREAAVLLEAHGEYGQAGELLEQALAENSKDEAVLAAVVSAYERGKRRNELETVLSATLPTLDPVPDDARARARRAGLWEKLAELRRKSHDVKSAIEAVENAVSIDSDRASARRLLASLYADKEEYAQLALVNRRLLVLNEVTHTESLRVLARTYAGQGRIDWARCFFETLELFGQTEKKDRAFLAAHPPPVRKPEDPYAGTIEELDRARYLAHPEARTMSEVFATIWEGLPAGGGPSVESLGLTPLDKVSPISDVVIAQIFSQVSKALGNRKASLYVSPRAGITGLRVLVPAPPAIVASQQLVESDPNELRFLLGRALEFTRPEYILGAAMPVEEFNQLLAGVLRAFHPRHSRWRAGDSTGANEQAAKLKKALPYKISKRLAELFLEHETRPFSSARWRTVVQETGNRAGLLVCGDLATAARVVLRESAPKQVRLGPDLFLSHAAQPGPLRELIRYALSEDYFTLREMLGMSVTSAAAA